MLSVFLRDDYKKSVIRFSAHIEANRRKQDANSRQPKAAADPNPYIVCAQSKAAEHHGQNLGPMSP